MPIAKGTASKISRYRQLRVICRRTNNLFNRPRFQALNRSQISFFEHVVNEMPMFSSRNLYIGWFCIKCETSASLCENDSFTQIFSLRKQLYGDKKYFHLASMRTIKYKHSIRKSAKKTNHD